ncbi:hypothetical protein GIB67_003309 [Kingdonia uniflora]|uniref:Uncharacterized protein n=1 Tax=Kingdonia uniflora TaxID=39325 RepID=A0A7J7P8M7_9MAGN|nr:hypothetical protein GIB67_003309 [Kingdonia uniflora]
MDEGGGKYKRGLWTMEEDKLLIEYIREHGNGRWSRVSKITGLKRGGKSCRLRWINYLSPTVKKGDFSRDEEDLIVRLHKLLGNRWSLIAGRIPGRTDNRVKNHWNTHLSKKFEMKKGKNKFCSSSLSVARSHGQAVETQKVFPQLNSIVQVNNIDSNGGVNSRPVVAGVDSLCATDTSSTQVTQQPILSDFMNGDFWFWDDHSFKSLSSILEYPNGDYPPHFVL